MNIIGSLPEWVYWPVAGYLACVDWVEKHPHRAVWMAVAAAVTVAAVL